jgi:endonuclease/exonuclease/phosphatase family metal-dependent hydrolase
MRFLLAVLAFALAYAPLAEAQTVTRKGSPNTFEVATWNIERFGTSGGPSDDALQFSNVKAVVEQSGIDLFAVQEIGDADDFDRLLDELGDDFGGTVTGGGFGIGFIWRTEVVEPTTIRNILTGQSFAFASRPPLLLEANITTSVGPTIPITFIVLHAKCCSGGDDYQRRRDASEALKIELDFTSLASKRVVVLGDFNDELTRSISGGGRDSPYDNFLQDEDDYRFLTLQMERDGIGTFCGSSNTCGGSSTIDHILISEELFPVATSEARRYEELLQDLSPYATTTSDHMVVYARFDLGQLVANESAESARGLMLTAPYPNPASLTASLSYRLESAGTVEVAVYDALGREVAAPVRHHRAPGIYDAQIDASSLTPGLYFVRLTAEGRTLTRALTVAR